MSNSASGNVLENNQRADRNLLFRSKIVAIIVLREIDTSRSAGANPLVCCRIVSRSRAKAIRTQNVARVNTSNVWQVIIVHIGYIGGAAKTAALESGDIRCEPGCRTAFCDGLRAVLIQPVGDFREIGRCAVLFENRSVILLRLHLVAGVFQCIEEHIVQHLCRNVRCRRRENTRRQHRDEHQHCQKH